MGITEHKCPYGLTLCTADDLCAHCERRALRALVREMGEELQSVYYDLCRNEPEVMKHPMLQKIMEAK